MSSSSITAELIESVKKRIALEEEHYALLKMQKASKDKKKSKESSGSDSDKDKKKSSSDSDKKEKKEKKHRHRHHHHHKKSDKNGTVDSRFKELVALHSADVHESDLMGKLKQLMMTYAEKVHHKVSKFKESSEWKVYNEWTSPTEVAARQKGNAVQQARRLALKAQKDAQAASGKDEKKSVPAGGEVQPAPSLSEEKKKKDGDDKLATYAAATIARRDERILAGKVPAFPVAAKKFDESQSKWEAAQASYGDSDESCLFEKSEAFREYMNDVAAFKSSSESQPAEKKSNKKGKRAKKVTEDEEVEAPSTDNASVMPVDGDDELPEVSSTASSAQPIEEEEEEEEAEEEAPAPKKGKGKRAASKQPSSKKTRAKKQRGAKAADE